MATDLEFGGDPEDFGIGCESDPRLPPPPPAPPSQRVIVDPPAPPPPALLALGAPPKDALEAAAWAYQLLMWQAYETMRRNMPEGERDRVVRMILRDAAKHQTDAARWDYLQARKRDEAEIEARRSGAASAKTEPLPAPPDGARVIPLRRSG